MTPTPACWCGAAIFTDQETGCLFCSDSPMHDPVDTGALPGLIPGRRVYLSGPMSGHVKCNYPEFDRWADELRSVGYEVLNPAEISLGPGVRGSYADLIRKDIAALITCQGVALLDDWEESHGSNLEVDIAKTLGMPVKSVDWWIRRGNQENPRAREEAS